MTDVSQDAPRKSGAMKLASKLTGGERMRKALIGIVSVLCGVGLWHAISLGTSPLFLPSPMTVLQAAAFQWVNPKTWIMAIGAVTAYTPENGYFLNLLVVTVIFTLVNGPCVAAWAGFGTLLKRVLDRPALLRAFNVAMALLLVASLYPILTMEI